MESIVFDCVSSAKAVVGIDYYLISMNKMKTFAIAAINVIILRFIRRGR